MRWVTCKYGQFGHDNWSACFCWCFSFGKNCWCHFWCWHAIAIDLFGEIALFSQVIPQCAICTLGAKCSIRIANNKVLTILWVVIKTVFFRCAIASYFEYFQTSRWDFKQGLELIKKKTRQQIKENLFILEVVVGFWEVFVKWTEAFNDFLFTFLVAIMSDLAILEKFFLRLRFVESSDGINWAVAGKI